MKTSLYTSLLYGIRYTINGINWFTMSFKGKSNPFSVPIVRITIVCVFVLHISLETIDNFSLNSNVRALTVKK